MKRKHAQKKSIAAPSAQRGIRARAGDQTLRTSANSALPTINQVLQPLIEKRFSQFKSDFEVAPVCLKEVTRIQALLAIHFLVLMLQTLLEREFRQSLASSEYESLPLYPEHRACTAPTTRRVIDIFETIQRHELTGGDVSRTYVTQLAPLQKANRHLVRNSPQ